LPTVSPRLEAVEAPALTTSVVVAQVLPTETPTRVLAIPTGTTAPTPTSPPPTPTALTLPPPGARLATPLSLPADPIPDGPIVGANSLTSASVRAGELVFIPDRGTPAPKR